MNEKEKYELMDFIRSEINKLRQEMQREINLLTDKVLVLEKLGAAKMFPRKICGMCSGTGKVFYGTVCEPPVGDCYVCNGKGFI